MARDPRDGYTADEMNAMVRGETTPQALMCQPHSYVCPMCGGEWSQIDGTDPQTHREDCPNA